MEETVSDISNGWEADFARPNGASGLITNLFPSARKLRSGT